MACGGAGSHHSSETFAHFLLGLTAAAGTGAAREEDVPYWLLLCNELLRTLTQKPQQWLFDQNRVPEVQAQSQPDKQRQQGSP